MTQAEKKALAASKTKPVFNVTGNFKQVADLAYGQNLWDIIQEICNGTTSNDMDSIIAVGADVKALAAPAMYYAASSLHDQPQLLIKTGEGNQYFYAGILRDKDGDAIISDDNRYAVNEVVAIREFKIPDSDAVITKGFRTLKAVAA